MFIDKVEILIKSGKGGDGSVAFRREKYVPNGGPAGGDGGKGGDIIFIADDSVNTLFNFKYKRKYIAEDGGNGEGNYRTGKSADDLIIKIPVGTVIKCKESKKTLADLSKKGQMVTLAKGGRGGKGNQNFATSVRQAPSFSKMGDLGEQKHLVLELKLIADVGLIGFPNVGKSTFLSMVTNATPKIANYHFTTLSPNLGVVSYKDANEFVIADIPGIIEGASEGVGLGFDFLRHIERTKLLVHVIDASGSEGRDILQDFRAINNEMISYNKKLASRKQIVVLNKIDLLYDKSVLDNVIKKLTDKGYEVFLISAATKVGFEKLLDRIVTLLDEIGDVPTIFDYDEVDELIIHKQEDEPDYHIEIVDGVYVVKGEMMRRLITSVDLDDYFSAAYFQRVLRNKGIINELEAMGISDGDTVRILDYEFEFYR